MNSNNTNNPESPVFSIITVCYNSEKTIFRTINSVLNQTFKNYEYIIVDGKSSDNTLNIVNDFESEFQGKLKVISEKDDGIYFAMNKGIKSAKGKYIGIINSDDWYETDTLKRVFEVISQNIDTIVYGLMRYYRNGKEFQIKSYTHEYLHQKMINHPTCFIPKKIYEMVGLFDVKYQLAADYDFILRCKESGYNFIHLLAILANMTMEGASAKDFYKSRKETYEILYNHKCISRLYKILRIIDLRIVLMVKSVFSFK